MKKKRTTAAVALIAILLVTMVTRRALAASTFFDDFIAGNNGWSYTLGNGGNGTNEVIWSQGGTNLYLRNEPGRIGDEFPLVGRNNAFVGINDYWRLSVRFRYPEVTVYGTSIAAGTAIFDAGSRQPQTAPVRSAWHNVLDIHQRGSDFIIKGFNTEHYHGAGGDTAWHTVELEVAGNSSYILRLDGTQIGNGGTGGRVPVSLWFGNYYTQAWWGNWTDIQVDWVRVEADLETPITSVSLSGTSGNAGWYRSDVQVALPATDNWSGVSDTQYRIDGGSWQAYSGAFTVSGEGTHTVEYRSTDNAGNVEAAQSQIVNIDTVAPVTTPSTTCSLPGNGGWCRGSIELTLSASDATSGVGETQFRVNGGAWQTYIGPHSISADGPHTIDYRSIDAAGNVESAGSVSFQVDGTPPHTTATSSGTTGDNGWYVSPVDVELNGSDATSGMDLTEYRIDGGGWQIYNGSFTISSEGVHTVEYRSTDVAGNVESVGNLPVYVDTVTPGSTINSPSADDWISGTVTIAGTASDSVPGSGLDNVSYSHDGGSSWQTASGNATWSTNWDTTSGPDGDHDLGSRAEDVAGNRESRGFVTVHVDNTPPNTTIALNGTAGDNGWHISPVEVVLSADDSSGIGVWSTEYRVDGGGWQTYSGPFIVVSGEGTHTIEYRSSDQLGNQEAVRSSTIRIDTVAPNTTANPSGTAGNGGWYVSPVDVELNGSDATSGVDLIEYRIDGGVWQTYSSSFPLSSEGAHTIEYRSIDVAGNGESDKGLTLQIDTADPDTTSHLYGTPGNAGWWQSAVYVVLDANDATSGVDGTEIDVDGGGWEPYAAPVLVSGQGHHSADYRSQDVAGNAEGAANISFQIDSIAPRTTTTITGTLGDNGWYTTPVTVTLSAVDPSPGSGVDEVLLDGQMVTGAMHYGDGNHSSSYWSTDVAGNRETAQILDLKVDTVPLEADVTGGTFCPICGEVIVLQPSASDAASGVAAWRLRILDGTVVVEEWSGEGQPSPRSWSGRDVDAGTYDLRLEVRDLAGWRDGAIGTVRVRRPDSPPPPPPSPTSTAILPTATPTLRPGEMPSVTPTPPPTSTPHPGATPITIPPSPTPTATPGAVSEDARSLTGSLSLVIGIFEDPDADAFKDDGEPGLAEWVVRVEAASGVWRQEYAADAHGLVTVTLASPDTYTFTVMNRPDNWEPTSRPSVGIRLGEEGDVVILPAGGGKPLPVGTAERAVFAFGLMPQRVSLWLPAVAMGLLLVVATTSVLDPRPQALQVLREAVESELAGGKR